MLPTPVYITPSPVYATKLSFCYQHQPMLPTPFYVTNTSLCYPHQSILTTPVYVTQTSPYYPHQCILPTQAYVTLSSLYYPHHSMLLILQSMSPSLTLGLSSGDIQDSHGTTQYSHDATRQTAHGRHILLDKEPWLHGL